MSSETISNQLDKFSLTSAVVGIGKTREEYLKLFSRACISPFNDRPYVIPMSGLYDTMNTSTSLILLNQRFKMSHLREQALFEELAYQSRKEFDYESLIELGKPKPKPKHRKKTCSPNILIDPYRHFERDNYNEESNPRMPSRKSRRKSKRSSSINSQSESLVITQENVDEEFQSMPTVIESPGQNYRSLVDKAKQIELDLQKYPTKQSFNERIKSSGPRHKLPLTEDQQIVLSDKYQIYDMKDTKIRRSNSYSQTLNNRLKADFNCKPQFRLNDCHEYNRYAKFLPVTRSFTPTSVAMKPMDNQKHLTNNTIRKSFTTSNNKTPLMAIHGYEPKSISTLPLQS
ncbi:unnamed protein product [Rotaria socialis]|uniref:Uncharacterized protein n=1 Tax=Rotaria socialis TaxID=392032 RepID=A0A818G9K2_9BILA|nr:unnamed protein product [Rotaria socialis]CAF3708636.1 unnamed protein product [Rotaria socialis]